MVGDLMRLISALCVTLLLSFTGCMMAVNVSIFDTGIHDKLVYAPTAEIFARRGWTVDYFNFTTQAPVAGVFGQINIFLFNEYFFKSSDDSPLKQSVLECFRNSLGVSNSISIIVMPHENFCAEHAEDPSADEEKRVVCVKKRLGWLGIDRVFTDDAIAEVRKIWDVGVPFRGRTWHTSLLLPTSPERKKLIVDRFMSKAVGEGLECLTLPELSGVSLAEDDVLRVLEPLGLLFDAKPAVSCIMVFASSCVVPTIAEDFRIIPVDAAVRDRVDEQVERFWDSMGARFEEPPARRREPIVRTLSPAKTATAWVQLTDLKTEAEELALARDLIAGGFTHLWLNDSPQMYYGIRKKKSDEQRVAMETQLARFCAMVSAEADRRGVAKPSLFIGFEIVNDFCGEHQRAENPAKDVYGSVYEDIPALTDPVFWQTAVVDPLAVYMKMYHTIPEEHQLPIAGPFIDLELYLRNLSGIGEFSSVMLCDDKLLKDFFVAQGMSERMPAGDARAEAEHMRGLVAFASQRARECGALVRAAISEHCGEGCDLGLYTMSVDTDWFCVNFVQGAFAPGTMVRWATFNTDFYSIKDAVQKIFEGVDIHHSSVLMLSKLSECGDQNLQLLNQCLCKNDGIWLNRFSRIGYPYAGGEKEWYFLEQPGSGFEGAVKEDFLFMVASYAQKA